MAYNRKPVTRKPRRYKRKGKVMTVAMYKSMEAKKTELKTFDTTQQTIRPQLTGVFFECTNMLEGVGDTARIGTEIIIKSLYWQACVSVSAAPGQVQQQVGRMMLFKWYEKGVPTLANILQYDTTQPIESPLRASNFRLIKVLMDKRVAIDANYKSDFVLKKYCKLNHKIRFDSGLSTVAEGKIFGLYISNQTGVTAPYNVDHVIRVRYTDN